MGKVPGLALKFDSNPDPRETQFAPEIQVLFERALNGDLPRNRELKAWEPLRLNERHLTMVMMRASGLKQRQIAEIVGCTDANASVVLNHPDAEYLLSRLQAARFSMPTSFERRLEALSEAALESIEELLEDKEIPAYKRAPSAFRLLEMNGHGKKNQPADVSVNVAINATPQEIGLLTRALRESKEIPEIEYTEVLPGGELSASPPLLPSPEGTDAPSISGPQA